MHRMYRMYTHSQGGWFVSGPYLRVIICVMALILTSCGSAIVDTSIQTVPKPTTTAHITPTPTLVTPAPSPIPQVAIGPDDWPTYLLHAEKDSYSQTETAINATTAPSINMFWSHHAGGGISTQPVDVNKTIFWGSCDGFE